MLNIKKSNYSISRGSSLLIIFILYAIFATIFGFAYRYAINPDGVSQLRLAGYIAEGKFLQSVTSSWSPLLIWLMSPFLYFGFDGLASARIAIALSGAGVLMSSWFLTLRFGLSQNMRFVAMLIAALLVADMSVQNINPDLPYAALILLYLYLSTASDILDDKRISFYCGIAGGFSYLAHHYALPFFMATFPLLLFLRGYINRDEGRLPLKKILTAWAAGVAGILVILSIWVGLVSVKYGHLMISSKGNVTYAVVGPKDTDRRHPFFVGGLYKPRDAYSIHVFEDPIDVKFKTWSPFESRAYFIHQLKLIRENAIYILNHFVTQSLFFNYAFIIGTLTLITIALLLNPLDKEKRFLYAWVVLTFCVYCSGLLLITAKHPRRFYAFMIVFLFLAVHSLEQLIGGLGDVLSARRRKVLTSCMLLIVVMAFALKPGTHLLKSVKNIATITYVNPYKEIAGEINTIDFPAPCAFIRSSQKPHTDTYLAYYLKKQLLGRPLSRDVEGITKELKQADAKSLFVFDNPEIAGELKNDARYIYRASIKLKDYSRYSYPADIQQDEITGWDKEVNIFVLKQQQIDNN